MLATKLYNICNYLVSMGKNVQFFISFMNTSGNWIIENHLLFCCGLISVVCQVFTVVHSLYFKLRLRKLKNE